MLAVLAGAAGSVAALAVLQARMIYHPRRYGHYPGTAPPRECVPLHYGITQDGRQRPQTSYYLPPERADLSLPSPLWVLFAGNGSLAANWEGLAIRLRHEQSSCGVLLMEYPGYGACQGRPTPLGIYQATEGAMKALARLLGASEEDLCGNICTMGHSLGTATSLQLAARRPVRRVVLASPFTSMRDMARLRVGWPLCQLLRHRYDNTARLREVLSRNPGAQIIILHGDQDRTIPVTMARRLAAISPRIILRILPGVGHTDIPTDGPDGLLAAMTGREPRETR